MANQNAEYKALDRVVTADKRQRKFHYALVIVLAIGLFVFLAQLANGAVARIERATAKSSEETNIIGRETARYFSCLLLIPFEKRTIETEQQCFDAADEAGGLDREDFKPIQILNLTEASATVTPGPHALTDSYISMSYPNPTAYPAEPISNILQSKAKKIKKEKEK